MKPPVEFSPGLWRGPQPTPEQWRTLAEAGVTLVIKLNTDEEGSDALAESMGMKVLCLPITILEQIVPNRFVGVSIQAAVAAMIAHGTGVLTHCSHGQDRTGLAVACYRLRINWRKPDAEQEMLDNGFHKMLLGLWEFWEDI